MGKVWNIFDDGGIVDVLAPSSRITFSDQSRRGLKRQAFKAVFDGNPFNPKDDDTFLEDYMADNNIVQFDSPGKKRIFDRALRRNLRDRESYLNNGYGILPTAYDGFSQMVTPNGVGYVRSEAPLKRDNVLEWMPFIGDAYEGQDLINSINDGDYPGAAMIAGLATLPGNIGGRIMRSPTVKRWRRDFSRWADKRLRKGDVLMATLMPERADWLYKHIKYTHDFNDPMFPYKNLRESPHVIPGRTSRFSRTLSEEGSTGDVSEVVDFGNNTHANIGKVRNTSKKRTLTSDSGISGIQEQTTRNNRNIASDNIVYSVSDNTVSPAVRAENQRINSMLGNDGVITGSASVYEIIPGTPNDVDIITTPGRKDRVVKRLGLKESGVTNAIGDSKYNLSSPVHGKTSVDLDIIHETNGHAEGTLAENIFAYTDPDGYYKWRNGNLERKYNGKSPEPIPYSADELYDMMNSSPGGVLGFNILNVVKTGRIKDNDRITSLVAVDPELVRNAVIQNGRSLFGSSFRSAEQLYPNMRFDNVEANKEFLRSLGLSESWASDPAKMRAVVEKFSFEKTTATRGVVSANSFDEFRNMATSPSSAEMVSGPGRNSVEGAKSGGGIGYTTSGNSVMQFPVTYGNDNVSTPMDLLRLVRRQTRGSDRLGDVLTRQQIDSYNNVVQEGERISADSTVEDLFNSVTRNQRRYKGDYDSMARANDEISRILDMPVMRSKDSYYYSENDRMKMSGYVGGLSKDYYGFGYDLSDKNLELGSLFPMGENSSKALVQSTAYTTPEKGEWNKIHKTYKEIGRAYSANDMSRLSKSGIEFKDAPEREDLLRHRRNSRISMRYKERKEDADAMKSQLLKRYTDEYRRIGRAYDIGQDIRGVLKLAVPAGAVGYGAYKGIKAFGKSHDSPEPDEFGRDVVNAVNSELSGMGNYSHISDVDEAADTMTVNIAYNLGVDPDDTESVDRIREYVKARLSQRKSKN